MSKVRVRFAPSPTGFLHIGSLRTVLFNYLIAKKENGPSAGSGQGKLILRIEDTDQKREVKGAVESLIEVLDWLGLKFDEGPNLGGKFGPYIQSQRLEIYKKYAAEALKKGGAYYCFCSPERLEKMRSDQQGNGEPPHYDRTCRDLSEKEVKRRLDAGEKVVLRQKMPLSGVVKVKDELRGEIEFKAADLEDHVLIKSDGMPTYQFASVVDDHLMEISHVLRGEEWIPSFPKNILLYKAFNWTPPKFIHMPLTLNKEGGKLSKRQGDVAVEDYRAKGYLPEALLNFSVLLGWSPYTENVSGQSQSEILSLGEMIKKFEIKDLRTSGAVFDIEKLDYFNGYYIRQKNLDELAELCRPYLVKQWEKKGERFVKNVIRLEQERLKKLSDINEATEFFFADRLKYEPKLLIWKKLSAKEVKKNLEEVYEQLEKIPEGNWTNDSIEDALMSYIKAREVKVGDYLWPMRVALTGRQASPGPFDVAEVLGKPESLKRIKFAISLL
ncbi:MAG: glutamate--tRNA ligase [Patescibacteria group bacterium]|nr:glutamate--tRNA ligase [Patescibacteria group bacterium]MDD5294394.1 glutamate--tRNA ligase [Patescibacteria group bacterium]MDD5554831.1 glutamate--tRNA ligase [Patescibacteria group bacterium]